MYNVKLCPLRTKTISMHNQANDYRVLRVGLNRCCDNDVIVSDFLCCLNISHYHKYYILNLYIQRMHYNLYL